MSDDFDDVETIKRGTHVAAPRIDAKASWRRLLVFGVGQARTIDLPKQGTLVLGRASDVDLRLDEAGVSRRHARLSVEQGVWIEDLQSANGTQLRDASIPPGQRVELVPGDSVEVGPYTLVLTGHRRLSAGGGRAVIAAPAMVSLYELIDRVAPGSISVLILGETGVGKEVTAEAVHRRSRRAEAPFVRLNCAALTESLIESELFGHEKGAFTGAERAKPGLIESAHGGTLFLDEVGELPLSTQVKLLRVLEERVVRRVGGLEPKSVDIRIVSATNRDLKAEIAAGRFREDLFFRLNGISLVVPALRERKEEIPALARRFIRAAVERDPHLGEPDLSAEGLAHLSGYAWPGNIRELRNVMERAVLLSGGATIVPEHLPLEGVSAAPPKATSSGRGGHLPAEVQAFEKERIIEALKACNGNQTRAAERLGIARRTLIKRLDLYGIERPRKGK